MRSAAAVLLSVLLGGCGGDIAESPWYQPVDTASASARLEDYFSALAVEDSATGRPGLFDEWAGFRFSRKATLRLAYDARRSAALRAVVTSRTTGEVVGTWRADTDVGPGALRLGEFPRDLYLLQVFISRPRIAAILFASE